MEYIIEENLSLQRLQFEKKLSSIAPLILQEISKGELFVERLFGKLSFSSNQFLSKEYSNTLKSVKSFELLSRMRIAYSQSSVKQLTNTLTNQSLRYIDNQHTYIDRTNSTNTSFDPSIILQRGYSITLLNGKILKDSNHVKKGETIRTLLNKGELKSTVV